MILRCLVAAVVLLQVVATSTSADAFPHTASPMGYTVTSTAQGVEVSVHFARRDFPKRALIAATDTIRNLSRPHLETTRGAYPYGPCQLPVVSLLSVSASGRDAAPSELSTPLLHGCHSRLQWLPIGHSYSERQYVVLWSSRLEVTAQLYSEHRGYQFTVPMIQFNLRPARRAKTDLQHRNGSEFASVAPPPGPHGPLFIQSWGTCSRIASGDARAYYWLKRHGPTVRAICPHPIAWHLDVAWLNTSVATINRFSRARLAHTRLRMAVP